MSNHEDAGKAHAGTARNVASKKATYVKPELRVYGPVTRLTQGAVGSKGDGSVKKFVPSDRRLKQAIERMGEHPSGVGLYLYEYRPEFACACGHGKFLGVMADEVRDVLPDAVSVDARGYLAVDYSML
jgi:hypothetical protein